MQAPHFALLSEQEVIRNVCLAGRIMSMRDMGKASFAELQDSATAASRLYVRKDDLDKGWRHIAVRPGLEKAAGHWRFYRRERLCVPHQAGRISVHVKELTLLAKPCARCRL
jgi:lysyl-tRNA synthetase class 2